MVLSLRSSQRAASCLVAQAAARSSPRAGVPAAFQTTLLGARRAYSAEAAPTPPLLQKLKGDLKTAMRARDAARLTVLRGVLSATLNASKTSSPVTTDAQLVALMKKTRAASLEAAAEFSGAGRADLADGERAQIAILDEYVASSGVEEVPTDELRALAAGVVAALTAEAQLQGGKARVGDVMKKLLAPGGPLDGKSVDRAELAMIVREVVG